eukprot:7388658-Prymnesium_polylepis.2
MHRRFADLRHAASTTRSRRQASERALIGACRSKVGALCGIPHVHVFTFSPGRTIDHATRMYRRNLEWARVSRDAPRRA